jgi:maltose alpha-D-glucosyltransferase/alpha-amylase
MVFSGVQKSTWNYDGVAKAWYFHRFYDFQPDLNTSSPQVQAEILKIMGFWLQLGGPGFRMDAVPFVISAKGATSQRPTEHYEMLRMFSEFLTWREGDAIILAEANFLPHKMAVARSGEVEISVEQLRPFTCLIWSVRD